jgi:hypothetical protein
MIGIFLPPMRRSWLISVSLDDASTASKLYKTFGLCRIRHCASLADQAGGCCRSLTYSSGGVVAPCPRSTRGSRCRDWVGARYGRGRRVSRVGRLTKRCSRRLAGALFQDITRIFHSRSRWVRLSLSSLGPSSAEVKRRYISNSSHGQRSVDTAYTLHSEVL